MKLSLIRNIFLSAALLSISAVGQTFAQQQTPNPVVKSKNSPFSPNPKKKAENANLSTATDESNKTVEISKTADSVVENPKNLKNTSDLNQNETSKTPELGDVQSVNFESRSVATKTLEVAEKANNVAVSPTEIYKVGNSDVLFISLQNAPAKESNYFTVLNDGRIDYPLAGEMVSVAGLTTDQIEDLLKEKIKLYENPQISVKVREHNSHNFMVLGLVEKPGEKSLLREAQPLYVVRAEAVVQSKANRVTIKRKDSEMRTVDLKDPKYGEVLIYPGDIVEFIFDDAAVISNFKANFYYIGGEIISGGQKDFYHGITLTQAILASGGLKKASVKKVVIRRKNEAGLLTPAEYDLKAIKEGKVADPELEAGDTVEIGNQ
jgi:protein involved in polysaccharide export with SLBB domain